jgi:cold shock CspA family protein
MPTGVMQWFDPRCGEGLITSRQGDYTVRADEVEPHARVTGARVQFDRVRVDGTEHAVRVRLRPGSRTSRRHGRFGDLKGAHHPEAKGRRSSLSAPPAREHRPMEVAERWLHAIRTGDIQAAAALHARDVVLHDAGGVSTTGPRAVQRWLQRTAGTAIWASAELHGRDGEIEVVWRPRPELEPTTSVRLRIAHGRIAELWDAPGADGR